MSKATIVIDMLNGFTKTGNLKSSHIQKIIPNIKNHLEKLDADEDILFVNDAHSESDLEMQQYPIHCLKNTYESEIVEELQPFASDAKIYYKNTTNAFFDIPLNDLSKYKSISVVGCCTDICVLQFVLTLKTFFNKINSEQEITVLKDCTATFDSESHPQEVFHDLALKLMQNAGVKIQ
ncbi:isochorismatase family cysteine hydrolase [Mycoplasmopsis ciconiae]|uniref:Isochorismatase family cysteine hydrolase n=1 Tax=Mycoplasmopsis ciconiae TaxID=561067 RepID=A0ABU7MLP2_9BACT|nr:isochorismatase family cysteine hydrolase [Mycoplasmopsis ciconiae]